MKRKKKFLLGVTKDNEIAFANVCYDTETGRFSADFDTVYPFEWNYDNLLNRAESYIDCIDYESRYRLCEAYDCRPSELCEYLVDDEEEMYWILDCSLFNKKYTDDTDTIWVFESNGCGQQRLKDCMKIYTNKELFDRIIELWEKYHLKDITVDHMFSIPLFDKEYEEETEEYWESWIMNYLAN